ncbi:asparagine synthase [Achlya hypogyna]|uniref:Asparagine synthase n=1 Tax=Achlya hypogyna TaxID=1202772 RepID=A0A1V9Z5A3_ACHHY|nr:asparagine synthase [Achlya hypogyna]
MAEAKIAQAREVLLRSIEAIPADVTAVLLSGGLDTSIIVDAVPGHRFTDAITVSCGSGVGAEHDLGYATTIAQAHGLRHHVVAVANPMDLMSPDPEGALALTIRILQTFDPMDLRGGVAITRALQQAKMLGITAIVTGDAADELFAGYSFLTSQPAEKLRAWIERAAAHMKFCGSAIGEALGIVVHQPFMHPDVIAFALTCSKDDLVGPDPVDASVTHGKVILRHAFPEAHSCWRPKVPLETGSGTTPLAALFKETTDPSVFEVEKRAVFAEDGIVIRDPEHLHYYRIFKRIFASTTSDDVRTPQIAAAQLGKVETRKPLPAFVLRVNEVIAYYTQREPDITYEGALVVSQHPVIQTTKAKDELGYQQLALPESITKSIDWLRSTNQLP